MKIPRRIIRRVVISIEDSLEILDQATENNFLTKRDMLKLEKAYDCLLGASILLKEGSKKHGSSR